jgi:metallophosphoesterase superfamily enzyme
MTLVRGNHDSRAGDPPAQAQIVVVDEPWPIGPFATCHHPQSHPTHFVLAGHDHPVTAAPGRRFHAVGGDRVWAVPAFFTQRAGTSQA